MKTLALTLLLGGTTVLLAACSSQPTTTTAPANTTGTGAAPAAEEKRGDTVKTGVISQVGEKFFLQEAGQPPAEIESYAVDLNAYVGQTVTVTGQYSGDTLFVGKVE